MSTESIPTATAPNGLRFATDLAPFAPYVNGGTVESAILRADHWTVAYITANGKQRRTKRVVLR